MKPAHLLDYGVGNIGSLTALLEALGYTATLTAEPEVIRNSPLLILPGVGSASTAMRQLHEKNILAALTARHEAKKPIVGVCLGAQLLFSYLEESESAGLGFLPGTVARLQGRTHFNTGWCRLDWNEFKPHGYATSLKPVDSFFFNHQYVFPRESIPGCVTIEGRPDIPAVYFTPHLCGIQFHPEKSQVQGRTLIRNIFRHYHGL